MDPRRHVENIGRPDGLCSCCIEKRAVTKDGRFCVGCLRKLVNILSPGYVAEYADRGDGVLIDAAEVRRETARVDSDRRFRRSAACS